MSTFLLLHGLISLLGFVAGSWWLARRIRSKLILSAGFWLSLALAVGIPLLAEFGVVRWFQAVSLQHSQSILSGMGPDIALRLSAMEHKSLPVHDSASWQQRSKLESWLEHWSVNYPSVLAVRTFRCHPSGNCWLVLSVPSPRASKALRDALDSYPKPSANLSASASDKLRWHRVEAAWVLESELPDLLGNAEGILEIRFSPEVFEHNYKRIGWSGFGLSLLLQAGLVLLLLLHRTRTGWSRLHSIQKQRMEQATTVDNLTGISNRMQFEDLLRRELARAGRYGRSLSLAIFDVDMHSSINDLHGHQVGDQVLVEVAKRVRQTIRSSDFLARWGGDEFVLLFPEAGPEGASHATDKLRKAIGDEDIHPVGRVTCSFGLAPYRKGDSNQTILSRAEAALSKAKKKGRNSVERED